MSRYMLHVTEPKPIAPTGQAVTPERAAELRAQWRATTAAWLERATWQELELWADTFASDHPEWFAEANPGGGGLSEEADQ